MGGEKRLLKMTGLYGGARQKQCFHACTGSTLLFWFICG